MFIGYANNGVAFRFLIINYDVIEHNTIVETKKMMKSLKHDNICTFWKENISSVCNFQDVSESEELRRNKRWFLHILLIMIL